MSGYGWRVDENQCLRNGKEEQDRLVTSLSECKMGFWDTLSRCPISERLVQNCRILAGVGKCTVPGDQQAQL
jgi:hypothetical protein